MTESEPRYEWRAWAERLDPVFELIRSHSDCHRTLDVIDTYLAAHSAATANPKLRDDRLDVKVLRATAGGFEQWAVHCKAPFPIEAARLNAEVFPLLGLTAPPLARPLYTLDQFLDEVVGPQSAVAVVQVSKHRRFHTVNRCIAEIADVTIDGRPLQTAAVESTDLDALREARRLVGLDRHDNVSYPRAIHRALGWDPT